MTEKKEPGYIVMFGAHKGGVGKSVLSTNLAAALAMKKEKPAVVLVEGDAAGSHSVLTWGRLREEDSEEQRRREIDIVTLADPGQGTTFDQRSAAITQQLADLQEKYDYIIIDGPPKRADVIDDHVAYLTDLIILPFYDLVSEMVPQTEFAQHLLDIRSEYDGHFKIGLLLNRVPGAERKDTTNMLRALTGSMNADYSLGVICQRKMIQHTFGIGVGVVEGRGDYHDRKSKEEMLQLRKRVLTVLSKI